jgi:hypothetical protein
MKGPHASFLRKLVHQKRAQLLKSAGVEQRMMANFTQEEAQQLENLLFKGLSNLNA